MKKAFFVILFILLAGSSFGQKIRFTDSTNVWKCYYSDPWFPYARSYRFYYDTAIVTIHGFRYRNLKGSGTLYVREDTMSNRVFGISNYPADTTEHLLYDFSLQVGDTFVSQYAMHSVYSIDSVVINGLYHKVWHLVYISSISPYFADDAVVIEGIGSVVLPTSAVFSYTFTEGEYFLTCFNNRGNTPALSHRVGLHFDNNVSCSLVGVNKQKEENYLVRITPNPMNEYSMVMLPHTIQSGKLTILNSIGREITNVSFEQTDELVIGDKIKIPGVYFCRVVDDISGEVFTARFVYQ